MVKNNLSNLFMFNNKNLDIPISIDTVVESVDKDTSMSGIYIY